MLLLNWKWYQVNARTCNKVAYKDKATAKAQIKAIGIQYKFRSKRAVSGKSGRKIYAYECPYCKLYHLTTLKPSHKIHRGK